MTLANLSSLVKRPGVLGALVFRSLAFGLFWAALTQLELGSWWLGAPAVLLASLVSVYLLPPIPLALGQAVLFVPYFIAQALLGAKDVSVWILNRSRSVEPEFLEYSPRFNDKAALVLFGIIVNLLPGTLIVGWQVNGDARSFKLNVHVLGSAAQASRQLQALELRLSKLFKLAD